MFYGFRPRVLQRLKKTSRLLCRSAHSAASISISPSECRAVNIRPVFVIITVYFNIAPLSRAADLIREREEKKWNPEFKHWRNGRGALKIEVIYAHGYINTYVYLIEIGNLTFSPFLLKGERKMVVNSFMHRDRLLFYATWQIIEKDQILDWNWRKSTQCTVKYTPINYWMR